eukprot:CAMPEP_0201565670 /NCGR_PEP_ID=MMETSP0190_2-20130828/4959_1 /ASSEMBLY_ACC=CAM_ASM_000263 /TAXON_ID=37353 /ORGANISM="Rosalina sp." /LENGTH=59 /DNA_ID=CAMNT_0047983437 /DNA_START=1216 /DNA_END=1392 /DNA_ORIENTATION=+
MGPLNPVSKTLVNNNNTNSAKDKDGKVETPGIGRAAKNAQNDLKQALLASDNDDEEMKD